MNEPGGRPSQRRAARERAKPTAKSVKQKGRLRAALKVVPSPDRKGARERRFSVAISHLRAGVLFRSPLNEKPSLALLRLPACCSGEFLGRKGHRRQRPGLKSAMMAVGS